MRERLGNSILILKDYLTYWRYYLTQHAALDFVSMGLGIQARYRRYMREWAPHLQKTKLFIECALESCQPSGRVAVLGAGRLLDFPDQALISGQHNIDLLDYDPSLMPLWQKLRQSNRSIKGLHCTDLTGVLENWTSQLRQLSMTSTIEEFTISLQNLPAKIPPAYTLAGYSCIVSLNILSQLGLYWQDRVVSLLYERGLLRSPEEQLPIETQQAINLNCAALELSHLAMLDHSGAERIVLVNDTNYIYYQAGAGVTESVPALETEVVLLNYRIQEEAAWEWQIAPCGAEGRDYSETHHITARSFALLGREEC
jgi:hypothetical protein